MTKPEKFFYKNMFYFVGVSILTVLLTMYYFEFLGYLFPIGLFTFPFTLYFANVLIKNVEDVKVIISILVAFLAQLVTYVAVSSFFDQIINIGLMFGTLVGFVLSHLINLLFYYELAKPRRGRRVKLLELAFVYFTAIIVNVLTQHIFLNAGMFSPYTFNAMLLAFGLQSLIGAVTIILDKNRKKEL